MNNIYTKRRWTKLIIVIVIVVGLIIGGIVVGVRHVYMNNLKPLSSGQKSQTVSIPSGYALNDVATLLKNHSIIRSDWAFSQYMRDMKADGDIKAGTYELSPSQSVQEIAAIITQGKIKTDLITILPGQRLDQIRKTLINSGFTASSVDTALNPDQYKDHPALVDKPDGANLEGYLYPDSFQKNSNTKAQDIIRESLDEMQKHLTADVRAAMSQQGLNVYQGIVLASIVEQEANKPSDRTQVAQVFLSRLHDGLRLESDVTAFYGASVAGQPKSVNYDSPYNTYLYYGLPVGPISNVSNSSLQAVTHPAATSYLYFIAGDDGTMHFSETLSEHQIQIKQYCQKSCPLAQ